MKRLLLGIAAAGALACGLALAAGGDRCPMMDRDGPRHECPMDDCPMHSRGEGRGGPMGGMGPVGGSGLMHGPERLLGPLGDELKLTDEQRTRIRESLDAARPDMDRLRDDMRNTRQELARIAPDDKAYDATVATASRRMGELTTQMIQKASELRSRVHAVLTPEQKQQMSDIRSRMMERMKERRERREQHRGKQHPGATPDPKALSKPEAT